MQGVVPAVEQQYLAQANVMSRESTWRQASIQTLTRTSAMSVQATGFDEVFDSFEIDLVSVQHLSF